jgi:hypothetical protein
MKLNQVFGRPPFCNPVGGEGEDDKNEWKHDNGD